MVKVKEDLTGRTFGRLTVIRQADDYSTPSGRRYAQWVCVCECDPNKEIIVHQSNLKRKITTSCGCYRAEKHIQDSKKYNKYDLTGEYGVGWTSNTNNEFYFDLEDFDKIKDYCWCEIIDNKQYHYITTCVGNNKQRTMHQILLGNGYDHCNRNPLDNRKENLRRASLQENARNHKKQKNNTSGVTGVYFRKDNHKWLAYIYINKKQIHIGEFSNKEDAIKARLQKECEVFGDFAPQKHLYEQYGIEIQNNILNKGDKL